MRLQHTATKVEMKALHKETKSDLDLLRQEMLGLHKESKSELQLLRQEMLGKVAEANGNIELLRQETKSEFKLVYEKMESNKKTIINTFGGMMIIGFGLVFGAIAIATNILLTTGAVG